MGEIEDLELRLMELERERETIAGRVKQLRAEGSKVLQAIPATTSARPFLGKSAM